MDIKIKKEIRKRALSIMQTYRNDGDYFNGKIINKNKYFFRAAKYIIKQTVAQVPTKRKTMTTYTEQAIEVKRLAERIILKSENFAKQQQGSPYFEDLKHVISSLQELDNFLSDEYIKQ